MSLAYVEPYERYCDACEHLLLHCHGVAAVHVTGQFECCDAPGCRVSPEAHELVMSCAELGCTFC